MIERCAQDGRSFWVGRDGVPVNIDEDGIGIQIDFDPKISVRAGTSLLL
jgi:hypothetical protein